MNNSFKREKSLKIHNKFDEIIRKINLNKNKV